MRIYDIIKKKRDGSTLTSDEINFFINGYTNGDIPDYQASAMLMAIYLKGLSDEETVFLTSAMTNSGDTIDLSSINGVTVDKHSTGGVGDKTTLIVAPVLASLGCKVAKMSGRGLGHTGGTIDKLESIDGFKVELPFDDFIKQVNDIGLCIVGQSGDLAPADKKLYALRDVTATVDNTALIASSIMSKKLASGSQNIVLDVKCGSGAFMKTPQDAKKLARTMVDIGNSSGKKTTALITNMDVPLGNSIGNSLEIIEAIKVLKNEGDCDDLYEICVMLASYMYSSCTSKQVEECKLEVKEVLKNGLAFEKFKQMIKSQGGNTEVIENPELFIKSKISYEIISEKDGYISSMDSEKIGIASVILGAGREKKDNPIDYSAGIVLNYKIGSFVKKGDILATFYSSSQSKIDNAKPIFLSSYEFSDTLPIKKTLIYEVVK